MRRMCATFLWVTVLLGTLSGCTIPDPLTEETSSPLAGLPSGLQLTSTPEPQAASPTGAAREAPPIITAAASSEAATITNEATAAPSPTAPPASAPAEERATAAPTDLPAFQAPTPPPAGSNTIRIALQSPMSGEWSALGLGIRNGAELALLQQSRALTDLGFDVEFLPFDDQGTPDVGAANAEVIVNDQSVLCVVGHFNSGVTLAAQPIYDGANLLQISPGSTNPAVTDDTENVWRVVGRDDVQGNVAARFARESLGSRRTYIIHDNTAYGRGIAQFFRRDAEANGPEVVAFTSYNATDQSEVDFTPFLEEITTLNPDVIYFAGSYERAGAFFKIARERGVNAQFLGSDSLDNPDLATIAGETVNGMHFTTVAAPVSEFLEAAQFAVDYKARYGQDAPPFSPESYDAAGICVQAIAKASRAAGGVIPTREQVLEAMRSLGSFPGISGNYAFNPNGDPISVGYYVIQVDAQNWGANRVVQRLLSEPPE
jgi:ABC-type branched-subunit amino acid transport system substrate-binding protein